MYINTYVCVYICVHVQLIHTHIYRHTRIYLTKQINIIFITLICIINIDLMFLTYKYTMLHIIYDLH